MSNSKGFRTSGPSEIDTWMLQRRLEDRTPKARLWQELSRVLGVTDRQVKRYYTGETPLPIDKIVPLCNLLQSTRLITYLLEATDPPRGDISDPMDFIEEVIKSLEAMGAQVRVAAQALNNTPSFKDFKQIQAAGRRLRDRLRRFEALYLRMLEEHHRAGAERARERRRRRALKLRRELEASGQLAMFDKEEP